MIQRIQSLGRAQRVFVYVLLFGGGLLLLAALAFILVTQALNSTPRGEAIPLLEGVTVSPFAVLPDDDAYPASLAVSKQGMVYTGSYVTGVIWSIDSAGTVTEIPNTRNTLGSVAGLVVAPDGTLLAVDRLSADIGTRGGAVMRVTSDGIISSFASINDERGFVAPDDIALDSRGRVYVSDWGRNEIWRFEADGSGGTLWWSAPPVEGAERYAVTGLAYDPAHDAMIVTDPEVNALYRVSVSDGSSETLYLHGSKPDAPGFDGATVTPDGELYVTALGLNRVGHLKDGQLEYLAGGFRGASDVDMAALPDGSLRLYVTNWDQLGLLVSAYQPRLPFGLDVIQLP